MHELKEKRRSAIEPEIGHQKAEGKLGRNWLLGSRGDALNAMLCGVGHNLRKILARLRRSLYAWLFAWFSKTWSMAVECTGNRRPAQIPQAA